MSDFRISKKVVLAVSQRVLGVPVSSHTKFETRLMLLNRLGFPDGVNAGRGYRGGYTIGQFWQLVLAFRLMKLGIGLSRLVEIINESWDIAYYAVAQSLPGSTFPDRQFWWIVEPIGLDDLNLETERKKFGAGFAEPRSIQTLALSEHDSLQDHAREQHLTEFLAIDAKRVVDDVLAALALPEFQIDQDDLYAELKLWVDAPVVRLRSLIRKGG
jgi:hypothetical protein